MKISNISRANLFTLGAAAIVLFAGCSNGGSSALAPPAPNSQNAARPGLNAQPFPGVPSFPATSGVQAAPADGAHSWIAPDAKKQDLLYVSQQEPTSGSVSPAIYIYSYPGLKPMGKLTGMGEPYGMCTDKAGNVWVTGWKYPPFASETSPIVIEYAHGGTKPIATLKDPNGSWSLDCDVDNKTGDLAVTNPQPPIVNGQPISGGHGNIVIYKGAKGKANKYSDTGLGTPYYLTYDNKSNLFIDGLATGSVCLSGTYPWGCDFWFAELPGGSTTFKDITLKGPVTPPFIASGVRWDGKYVDVMNTGAHAIYQTTGASGQIVNTIQLLPGACPSCPEPDQYWIEGKTLIVPWWPDAEAGFVGLYRYPSGGSAYISLGTPGEAYGVVISKATK